MARPRNAELSRDLYLDLVRLHELLFAEFSELFRLHGLTQSQYNLLRILRGAPEEGLRCQTIGERLLNRVPDVTRLLDRLEAAEMVVRERSRSDRRVVLNRITAKGKKVLADLDEPVLELHLHQFAHLTKQQQSDLRAGLRAALERQD